MSKHPSPSTTPDPYRQVASSQPLFTDEAAKKSAPELPARRPTGPQFQYLSGPVYHDIWAIVLFLLNFAGFVVLTSIGLTALGAERTWSSEDVTVVDRTAEYVEPSAADKQSLITIVVTCAGAGIAMAFGYLLLMQR